MSDKEFVQWFRGFVEGAHHYNITPKQWDDLKDKLALVNNNSTTYNYTTSSYWTTTVAY